jgi:phage-related minor tail protein
LAKLGEISVEIGIDTKEFKKGMDDVGKAVKVTGKQIDDTGKGIQDSFDKAGKEAEKTFAEMLSSSKKVWVQLADGSEAFIDSMGKLHQGTGFIKDVDGLGKAYKEALNGSEEAAEKLKKALIRVEGQTEKVSTEGLKGFAKFKAQIQNVMQEADKLGQKMKEVGNSLSKSVVLPATALGGAASFFASEYDQAAANIKNSLGVVGLEAEKLTGIAQNIYEDGFGQSFEEIQRALIQTKQNIHNLDDGELEKVAKNAQLLAQTFDSDVNEVTRAASNVMNAFGISADEAFDLMAKGGQSGINFSNEMFDNLAEFAPLYASMGISADEYFGILERGAKANVYNLDFINDLFKEFQIRAKDGSKATADAMGQLSGNTQQVWKDFNQGKGTVKDVHNAVINDLKGMENQVLANQIGVALYGTKWEDLESEAIYAIGAIEGGMSNVDGTMSKMVETQEATFGNRFQGMLRELKSALLPLGFVLLDLAESIMPLLTSAAKKLSEWFSGLSPIAQNFTVVAGAIGTALGPVLGVLGKLGGVFKKIVPYIKNAGGMMGLLSRAALLLTGPVGATIGILAGLGIGAYKVGKMMSTAAIESNVFGEEVSESTKKAVGAYLELDNEVRSSVNSMAWSNQVVTEEMAKDMISKYQTMGDTITTEMKKDHEAQLLATQDMFAKSSALTEEEEAEILKKMQENDAKELEENTKHQERIKEIWETAAKEKRDITDVERAELNNIQNQMRTDAVVVLSESAAEQKAILTALKQEKGVISAEVAADTVQKSLETRNQTIQNAKDEYLGRIAEIERMRDESGEISEEQATKLIEEAKKTRDETVKNAEDMHLNVVEQAKLQAGEHVNQVDWETGEIKSKWTIFKEDTVRKAKEMYTGVTEWFKEMWKSITTKATEISTSVGTKFGEIKTKITGKIEEAKTRVGQLVEDIKGFFTNMKLKLPHIKMPSFSVQNWSMNPADWIKAMPKLKISWNKTGGFIDNAGLVGINGGVLQGAGEGRKKEAIVPLEYRQGMMPFSNAVAEVVSEQLGGMIGKRESNLNINVESMIVREESDIQKIARELYSLQQRKTRGS